MISNAPSRHPGTEIGTDLADDYGDTAGHILAAVRSAALDHHLGTRVAHGKALAGPTSGKKIAVRRAIKHGVADNRVVARRNRRGHGRAHDDATPGQALAHVVIGIARNFQLETGCRESPQRLARRP